MTPIKKFFSCAFATLLFTNTFFADDSSKNQNRNQLQIEKNDLMQIVSQNSADIDLNLDLSKYPEDLNFWSNYPNPEVAYVIAKRMTNEELLAQIFMFGWAGAEPSDLLNRWVQDRGLGSVKVFGWNTDNTTLVAKSISSLQKKSTITTIQNSSFRSNRSRRWMDSTCKRQYQYYSRKLKHWCKWKPC